MRFIFHIIFLAWLFLGIWPYAMGQIFDYGNDWYKSKSAQTFVKLVVAEDGIYRLTAQDLTAAGHDISSVNPDFFQLYYRGKEVPLYVTKTTDSRLQYLEFFGKKNDGAVDSIMYRQPLTGLHGTDLQPNPNISLYSDSSAYFLTWGNSFGKRYISFFDPLYNFYTPEPYFQFESKIEYQPGTSGTTYIRGGGGPFNSFYTLNSDYVTGEGYAGPSVQYNRPRTVQIATPKAANRPGSEMTVKARIFGRSNTRHTLRIELNGQSGNPVLDTTRNASGVYIKTYSRNYAATLNNITDLTFVADYAPTDNNNLCWASITYERNFEFDGDSTLRVRNWEKNASAYFQLKGLTGNDSLYVYDLGNPFRFRGTMASSTEGRVIIPPFAGKRNFFITTDRGIKKPIIEQHKLTKLFDPNGGAEYVIITHPSLAASAQAYANYRDTATVNEMASVKVVYTDEIYDEYGYGTITPWAIKRFCKDALDNWRTKPGYFFLWGKGKFLTRDGHPALVPTFGYPATDWEYVSHFDPQSPDLNPEAAIGRVNVYNDQEGFIFLDKINEYEHSPWQPWMKEAVFLGGGANAGEQNAIGNTFNFLSDVYTDVPLGGDVHYFQKTSSLIGDPNLASYHDEITEGTAIIHFFGHSTSNIQDITIRNPNEYTNFGKYPFLIAMGCYGGDFTGGRSFGESWLVQEKRGAIAYLGNSSAGYLNPLRDYARIFYPTFIQGQLSTPMGKVLQRSVQRYTDSLNTNLYRNHARQLNLQGDPGLILYSSPLPDYEITNSSIYFEPEDFSAQDDSFRISIIIQNKGLAVLDSFNISIRQRLPSGVLIEHPTLRRASTLLLDTVSVYLQNGRGNLLTGQNTFEVFVDADEEIDENVENNNFVSLTKVVPGNIPATLYPPEFAIVGESQIHLDASAFFMTRDQEVGYIFEIDTTETFSSPSLVSSGPVTGNATYVKWDVPFTLRENTVYFWRVRLSNVNPSVWGNSSFKYMPGKTGWAQAKTAQFTLNPSKGLVLNKIQKEWEFRPFSVDYEVRTRPGGYISFRVNGQLFSDFLLEGFYQGGVGYSIIDQYDLGIKIPYGPASKARFVKTPEDLDRLKQAILEAKEGDYFIMGGTRNPQIHLWDDETFEILKLIGATDNLRLLKDGDTFLLLGRKGFSNSAQEILAPNAENELILTQRLLSNFDKGTLISPIVGPALEWNNLLWGWETKDLLKEEKVTLSIFGLRNDNTDSLLFSTETEGELSIDQIDANKFPNLRLEAFVQDSLFRTSPQLDNWHVIYQPVPDAVVDPNQNFEFQKDSVGEGQNVFIHLGANNITIVDMDSLLVKYTLENSEREQTVLDSVRIAPLPAGGHVEFEYSFNTGNKNLDGDTKLIVEINPNKDQPEQYFFNNIYTQDFYVLVDRINPILDVTIDGKHIVEGDIVSANPEILVQVNDENPFIATEDTASIELFWRKGSIVNSFERIFPSDPRVEWQAATLPENKLRLYFYPGKQSLLEDGEYTLRVQGKDQKGNVSGTGESFYEINFEVVNESSVTHLLNYPNPFSTATRFVYTLTGAEMPEVFQVHIYSISGRLVKVIDLLALGDVHFGRNITEYAWDGTDEYGDRLDNGVYVYRVVTKLPNETMNHRETTADSFFKNGWGKMYLMR